MARSIRSPRVLALVLAAALAACSDAATAPSTSTAPAAVKPVDVATLAAELDLPGTTGMVATTAGISLPGVGLAACTYTAASQSFVCPTTTTNGLTITASYTLLDVAGRPLATSNAATVAAMHVVSTVDGKVTAAAGSATTGTLTIAQRQDVTLSGLLTGTHTLDGTSRLAASGSVSLAGLALPVATSTTSTTTIRGVVLSSGGTMSRWPLAGTVTTVSTNDGVPALGTITQTLTFNGSSKVTVTLTGLGLTARCEIDLSGAIALASCT